MLRNLGYVEILHTILIFHITRRSPHVVIIMIIGVRLLRMILIQQEFIIIEKQAGLGIMS